MRDTNELADTLDDAVHQWRAGTGDPLVLVEEVAHALRLAASLDETETLHEKCGECHLFVYPNAAYESGSGLAQWSHGSRGDDADERIEDHEPWPSGMKATLRTWRVYGPSAMRERFVLFGRTHHEKEN